MSRKIISIFTFGVFLLVAGAVAGLFDSPQSMVLIATGLTFEVLALLIFAWNKIKKR